MIGVVLVYFFCFQAEDGIPDLIVTGVQTCALPIYRYGRPSAFLLFAKRLKCLNLFQLDEPSCKFFFISLSIDRKSTRLNSSHDQISYAVFCLKKKKSFTIQIENEYV